MESWVIKISVWAVYAPKLVWGRRQKELLYIHVCFSLGGGILYYHIWCRHFWYSTQLTPHSGTSKTTGKKWSRHDIVLKDNKDNKHLTARCWYNTPFEPTDVPTGANATLINVKQNHFEGQHFLTAMSLTKMQVELFVLFYPFYLRPVLAYGYCINTYGVFTI